MPDPWLLMKIVQGVVADAGNVLIPCSPESADASLRAILDQRDRARLLARNLFDMVPREVWRDQGGDDGQGHYEGDYYAEQVEQEIRSWSSGPISNMPQEQAEQDTPDAA